MLTVVLYALAAIAVAAVIVVVLVVVLPDDQLAEAAPDRTPTGLPVDRPVGADDLEKVRLPVGVRGYRMVETDAVIDRLVGELERRDQAIAALRAERDHRPADASPAAGPGADPGPGCRPAEPGWRPAGPDPTAEPETAAVARPQPYRYQAPVGRPSGEEPADRPREPDPAPAADEDVSPRQYER